MAELWGSLSVSDHVRRRALVAEVLLFDRIVMPVPPEGDAEEQGRWADNNWNPERQRRMLSILGVGGRADDLVVTIPWTKSKRDRFSELWKGLRAQPDSANVEHSQLLSSLRFDSSLLRPDAFMATRILLTRDYDSGEAEYVKRLPRVSVEKVVPAYTSFQNANRELAIRVAERAPAQASAQVIGWELFVPEKSTWTDERALEAAASLSRHDDYRMERESFRDWWRLRMETGTPAADAVRQLVKRADHLNKITRKGEWRSRTLRSFAALGGMTAIGGAWFPPVAIAGGLIALVGIGADWILKDEVAPAALAPAAMFTDARKHFGWR